jgi:peptidoglycan hydrolase-like protein with peptidoglycan-binding domain
VKWRAVVAPVVVVAVGGGVWAATRITSPEQAAADAAPPVPSTITVALERRVLRGTLITRADVVAADGVDVSVAAGADASKAVVTATPVGVGGPIVEGAAVVVVSGRPVIALQGGLPAYRDLGPGKSGPDVQQLHDALARLGIGIGADTPGTYGAGTQDAVRELYSRAGFDAPLTSEDAADQIQAALAAVESAALTRDGAEAALAEAQQPPSVLEQRQADLAVQSARRSLTEATATANESRADAQRVVDRAQADLVTAQTAVVPEGDVAKAQVAVGDAERMLQLALVTQTNALANAQVAVVDADKALQLALVTQTNALANAQVAVAQAAEALRLLTAEATQEERLTAQRTLDAASRNLTEVQLTQQNAVASAQRAVDAAGRGLTETQLTNQNAVAAAQSAVDNAKAEVVRLSTPLVDETKVTAAQRALDDALVAQSKNQRAQQVAIAAASASVEQAVLSAQELGVPVDTTSLRQALEAADAQVVTAFGQAAGVAEREGVVLAQGEVVFVPSFPATVAALSAPVGQPVPSEGPLVTIGSGSAVLRARVPLGEVESVAVGLPVAIEVEAGEPEVVGTVAALEPAPADDPSTGAVAVIAAAEPLALETIGRNVKVTIETASTAAEVLVAPTSAIYSGADGSTNVDVFQGETIPPTRVPVEVGLVADGWVEVTPVESTGGLEPGALLVVGARPTVDPSVGVDANAPVSSVVGSP